MGSVSAKTRAVWPVKTVSAKESLEIFAASPARFKRVFLTTTILAPTSLRRFFKSCCMATERPAKSIKMTDLANLSSSVRFWTKNVFSDFFIKKTRSRRE